ncbi:MAG: hypothetical protein KJ799_18280 [Bacteroidetes bacterium]|nr:hypothetical protein [Bacteroidota bacterium]MBU1679169.1 hypothetical protein [Bacteroidota bacterium]MBU2508645.1 hypothetical protein [Bacteroidota bacterium]
MANALKILVPAIGFVFLSALAALMFQRIFTEEEIEITIIKMQSFKTDDNETGHLIYTKDEVFVNVNNAWQGKRDAEIIQKKLHRAKRFKVKVIGYKLDINVGFLPQYRNIIEVLDDSEDLKSKYGFSK